VDFVLLRGVYLVATCGRASQKLFWHDELFTVYLTRLPNLSAVWRAIEQGAEAAPPLFSVITRASIGLFGEGLISGRLPGIVGFLVASLAVYSFVKRRYGALYGLVASLLPSATHAYVFAYEARPYGLVLGFAGIAMVAWQRAAEGRRRVLWLLLLGTSLSAAVLCHYYAVLLLAPLALAEMTRLWSRRTPDWAMWVVFVAPLTALALMAPLIRSAVADVPRFYSAVSPAVLQESYESVLVPLSMPAVVMLIAMCAVTMLGRRDLSFVRPVDATAAPLHEWVAVVGLMLLPLWGAIVAQLITGGYMPRYGIAWVLGFSITTAFVAATVSTTPKVTGAVALVTLLSWTSAKMMPSAKLLAAEPPTIARTNAALLATRGGSLPIVVTHAHVFFPLVEYAPRDIAARLVMLAAPPRVAPQWIGTSERTLMALSTMFPLRVDEFDTFIARYRRFMVYGPPMWVTEELRAAGARLDLKGEEREVAPFSVSNPAGIFLYEVTFD